MPWLFSKCKEDHLGQLEYWPSVFNRWKGEGGGGSAISGTYLWMRKLVDQSLVLRFLCFSNIRDCARSSYGIHLTLFLLISDTLLPPPGLGHHAGYYSIQSGTIKCMISPTSSFPFFPSSMSLWHNLKSNWYFLIGLFLNDLDSF